MGHLQKEKESSGNADSDLRVNHSPERALGSNYLQTIVSMLVLLDFSGTLCTFNRSIGLERL